MLRPSAINPSSNTFVPYMHIHRHPPPTYPHTHARTHACTLTHARAHIHTHTHTHTQYEGPLLQSVHPLAVHRDLEIKGGQSISGLSSYQIPVDVGLRGTYGTVSKVAIFVVGTDGKLCELPILPFKRLSFLVDTAAERLRVLLWLLGNVVIVFTVLSFCSTRSLTLPFAPALPPILPPPHPTPHPRLRLHTQANT